MRTETRNSYLEGIERVVSHVSRNLGFAQNQSLDPAALAHVAGFSTFHFHRIFRGMMGESLGDFVRRLRLEKATYLLAEGKRVTDVAFECGFESHEAFTRAFRTAFGVPPSTFVRESRAFRRLPNPTVTHYDSILIGTPLRTFLGDKNMNVEIREIPGFHTLAMRHTGPYWQIGATFQRLAQWAAENGVPYHGSLAAYYDNPESTPAAELRSDACLVVAEGVVAPDDSVVALDIKGGRYAVTTHNGPYSNLGDTWGRFFGEWFPSSGYTMGSEPSFELYLNSCDVTPPEDLRTEIYQQIV